MDQEVRQISLKKHPLRDFSLQVGDTAKISLRIKEGGKERIQVFEGLVLKIQGSDYNRSFTAAKSLPGLELKKQSL